ncbi:MAG TPA: amidohydrolase family protein [Streptosporangiaceae bacterium]|nr:amidohydrolase family protein [Streptosporangiaceae bacterium]
MRLIAIEEHFNLPEIEKAPEQGGRINPAGDLLYDLDDGRLASMDAAGIDVQVLSSSTTSVQYFEPARSVELARKANDHLAAAIERHPDRFYGFATLPTPDPAAAVVELERTVREYDFKGAMIHGHTNGKFLDHKDFWPILEAAEALGVPIYLHPTYPPRAVFDAYYGDLEPPIALTLSAPGWGWHVDAGMHTLRLVLAGVFDRFPGLQLIIGHMGEAIPFNLARAESVMARPAARLQRRISEYFLANIFITTSGYFTFPPLLCAIMVLGADRIIFSVDYPFSDNQEARTFFDAIPLSAVDKEKIAHGNVEALLGI